MNTLPKPEIFNAASLEEEIAEVAGTADAYAPARARVSQTRSVRRLDDNSDRGSSLSRSRDDQEISEQDQTMQASEVRTEDEPRDAVNHPRHYTVHPSGVECITVTRWMNFNLGNVVKYVWRSGEKGATIEDLRKARWYLDDEIKRLEGLVK